jgi:hypothetical protein
MSTKTIKRTVGIVAVALALGGVLAATTEAKPGYLAEAKKLGYPAQDCRYCHTKASGGSGWNARGNWLRSQKRSRNAREVQVSWLSEYGGD